jgi:hypothetical protein
MDLRRGLTMALAFALLGTPGVAQTQPGNPAATRLATVRLPSVVDMPLYFRLYSIHLPPAQRTIYEGANAMLYGLSGTAAVDIDGTPQPLPAGAGTFIAAGRIATISASTSEPVAVLLFMLTPRPNQRRVTLDRPAVVKELFRTPEALPGLRGGPYEFTLTRLTFAAGRPASAPYYRSGAALDYVLAGTAAVTADGKTDATPADAPLFERYSWVHRLTNLGAGPLVLLQANINREGEPAVHVVPEK